MMLRIKLLIKFRFYLKIVKNIFDATSKKVLPDSGDKKNSTKDDSVNILPVDDEKTKTVGEILSNDTSRKILNILSVDELTANQIAQKMDVSIALVAFHLKKMQDVDLVKISKVAKSVKSQEMKYYSATKKSVLITPAKHTDSILESVRKYSRFAVIGIAGIVSWFVLRKTPDAEWNSAEEIPVSMSDSDLKAPQTNTDLFVHSQDGEPAPVPAPSHSGAQDFNLQPPDSSIHLDRTVYPQPFGGTESTETFLISIIIPIIIVVAGLVIERLVTRWMNKKRLEKSRIK